MIINKYENIPGEYYTLTACIDSKGIIDKYGLKKGQEYHKKQLFLILETIREEGYQVDVAFNTEDDDFFAADIRRKGTKSFSVILSFDISDSKPNCNFYGDNFETGMD